MAQPRPQGVAQKHGSRALHGFAAIRAAFGIIRMQHDGNFLCVQRLGQNRQMRGMTGILSLAHAFLISNS